MKIRLYCHECRAAGMKNDFAIGNKTAGSVFKTSKLLSSERETMGLLFNVHFLATNGLSMNKGAPLHALFDFYFTKISINTNTN